MKKNINSIDRTIRVLLAALVIVLYYVGSISGTTAIVLGIIAIILLATSFISFCPLYHFLGISTRKKVED